MYQPRTDKGKAVYRIVTSVHDIVTALFDDFLFTRLDAPDRGSSPPSHALGALMGVRAAEE
jgi:hypothetical protein